MGGGGDELGEAGGAVVDLGLEDGTELVLAPYADASQTGGDIRVWIPESD